MLLLTNENHTATLRSGILSLAGEACTVYGAFGNTWCKDTKIFLYINTFAQKYTLFNRQCLNTGTNKREKQFFDLKVQSVALQSSKQGAGHYDNGEFVVYDFLISTFQV